MNYHLIMGHYITNQELIVGAVILAALVAVAIVVFIQNRRTRTTGLKNRFGSEYERAVVTHGSARQAEAKLSDRETRVQALKIRELGATERERFVTEWHTIQSRFVDHPKAAVTEADGLINALLIARGYPQAEFEQRAADISVGSVGSDSGWSSVLVRTEAGSEAFKLAVPGLEVAELNHPEALERLDRLDKKIARSALQRELDPDGPLFIDFAEHVTFYGGTDRAPVWK